MIHWREEMAIGIAAIDDDHKTLIALINRFEDGADRREAEKICRLLYAYTQSHFHREEQIQQLMRYPNAAAHRQEHKRILDNLMGLIKEAFLADSSIDDKALIARLSDLLHDWIIDHVVKEDRKLRRYIGVQAPPPMMTDPLLPSMMRLQ